MFLNLLVEALSLALATRRRKKATFDGKGGKLAISHFVNGIVMFKCKGLDDWMGEFIA
jgi:hypothetical protein